MFYPIIFPHATDQLPADRVLATEAILAELFVRGDRGWFDRILPNLSSELTRELVSLGYASEAEWSGLEALLAANRGELHRFVEERVIPSERYAHWEWLQPDWQRVRAAVGVAAAQEWQRRIAGAERDLRAEGRRELSRRVEAA